MGARQVGKSTLLQMLFGERKKVIWMNGDEPDIHDFFSNMTSTRLKAIIAKCPASFLATYQNADYKVITPGNIEEFLLK